jgi:hypothetical protein
MATRFAVATGNFSNPAIWDNGAVPTSDDDVYANNRTITIDGTYTVQTIRNTVSPVSVPNIATPIMTSNTTPSGVAFASSTSAGAPWIAFNQDGPSSTFWQSATNNTGILGYQFTSGKIIKRYSLRMTTVGATTYPTTWTFQGSNDGTTYTTLDTVTGASTPLGGSYTSGILANTTSYTYYRINITAVSTAGTNPTISDFEMTESTGTVLGNATGGQFIYANGGNLTCTAAQAIFAGSTTPVLEMALASGNTAIFSGSVLTLTNTNTYNAIRLSGTGTLTCTGNYNVDNGSATKQIINVTSTGTLNIIGDLSSTVSSAAGSANALLIGANATINVTGNITASSGIVNAGGSATVISNSNSTLNVTGNITGAATLGIYTTGSTVNIIGSITGGTSVPGLLNNTAAATISITGVATSSATAPAVVASFAYTTNTASGTLVKVSGNPVNANGLMAIIAPRVTIDTATSSWLFQISTGGNRTLYAAGVSLGNPATSNVRFGTTYGASSELTGTLRVPSTANVLSGVLVDNTTGTLLMTPADFWNYLIASGFTANSIGDRLQNASTVATTGGQIASYNI